MRPDCPDNKYIAGAARTGASTCAPAAPTFRKLIANSKEYQSVLHFMTAVEVKIINRRI